MLTRRVPVLAVTVWLATRTLAVACSCADPGPPCRAIINADAVFVGEVVETSETAPEQDVPHPYRRVRLRVDENFRGAGLRRGGTVDVLTGFGGGDCGYAFETGRRYLVYAQHFPDAERLFTGICTRTRALGEATNDLAYLRTRNRPERAAGIEGTIHELARDAKSRDTRMVGPMPGVPVVAEREGDGRRFEAKTDGQGWFRIWDLTFGRYRVRAVLPEEFVPEATARDDVVVERGVCGWVHMLATPRP